MLKNRTLQILVVIGLVVISLVSTISAANPPATSEADLSWPPRPEFQHLKEENLPSPSYRDRLDECFDVSIRELATCRNTSQAPSAIPVTGGQVPPDVSDYHQRHANLNSTGATAELPDYFLQH